MIEPNADTTHLDSIEESVSLNSDENTNEKSDQEKSEEQLESPSKEIFDD